MTTANAVHRLVTIDMGSNATKVKVWHLTDGSATEEAFLRYPIRLGASVFTGGALDAVIVDRLIQLFTELQTQYGDATTVAYRAVATSALREATNREQVRDRVRRETGIDVRVVGGEEEARLMALGILGRNDAHGDRPHLLLDIGGGSSEIILTEGLEVRLALSIPIGAVRLKERCWHDDAVPSAEQIDRGNAFVDSVLDRHLTVPRQAPETETIGLAGTITTLRRMMGAMRNRGEMELLPDCVTTMANFANLSARLRTQTPAEIVEDYGIEPDRAEVILGGSLILLKLMDRLGVEGLRVMSGGVADGLLQEYLRGIRTD